MCFPQPRSSSGYAGTLPLERSAPQPLEPTAPPLDYSTAARVKPQPIIPEPPPAEYRKPIILGGAAPPTIGGGSGKVIG
jgi:hypothetical protein